VESPTPCRVESDLGGRVPVTTALLPRFVGGTVLNLRDDAQQASSAACESRAIAVAREAADRQTELQRQEAPGSESENSQAAKRVIEQEC
jgi:hypothetical protein